MDGPVPQPAAIPHRQTKGNAPLWYRRVGLHRVVAYPTPLIHLNGDKAIAEFLERLHAVDADSGATFRAEQPN